MSLPRLVALALALAAAVALPGIARADLPTFELVAENGHFSPETLDVPAHTRFRLRVTNRNAGPEEFETTRPFKELVLAPGATRTTVFPPLPPGSYPFFGEFHRDTAQGRIVAR